MVKTPRQIRLVALYMAVLIFVIMILSGCSSTTGNEVSDDVKIITTGSTTTTYIYDRDLDCLISSIQVNSKTGITIKTDYFWGCDNGYIVMNGSYTTVIDSDGNIIPDEYTGGTCGI